MRHDIIDAVVSGPNTDLLDNFEAATVLAEHQSDDDFKEIIEALNRVLRLAAKRTTDGDVLVDAQLFENDSEAALEKAVQAVEDEADDLDVADYFKALAQLKTPITDYFEATMIMADDSKVKNNRLNQLQLIADLIYRLGDLNQLIVK